MIIILNWRDKPLLSDSYDGGERVSEGRRTLLLQRDAAIQGLTPRVLDSPCLTGIYHKLLRQWSNT